MVGQGGTVSPHQGGADRQRLEDVSRLVERLALDHIGDEDAAKDNANQHGGGGDRQHDSLLLLSANNCFNNCLLPGCPDIFSPGSPSPL